MFLTFALVFLNFVACFDLRTFLNNILCKWKKKTKCFDLVLLVTYSSQQLTNDRNVIYSISIFHTVCPPIDHEEQPIKMGVVFSLYEMIYNKRSS